MKKIADFSLPPRLDELRKEAKAGRDPTAADQTLCCLMETAQELHARHILEIGAGKGLTSIALYIASGAQITAIEFDSVRAAEARTNYAAFSVPVRLIEGDAGEILPMLEGTYDLIFLDGPKVQYLRYLPDCKRLLKKGGVLFSDDILLFGWVRGEAPKKRHMLVEHIREYLWTLEHDPDFQTTIYEYGEGLAVSKKLT